VTELIASIELRGAALSTSERQMFIGFLDDTADAADLLKRRVTSLLRKWLDGGRLSKEERDEIAHMLPDAAFIIDGTASAPSADIPSAPAMTEKEAMDKYQLSRATFFRWKNHGSSVADGPDAPPWEDPVALVAWYERMRARGIFKHKCPKALLAAAGKPAAAKAKASTPSAESSAPKNEPPTPRQAPGKRGFLAELEALQEQTAMMREDYEEAVKAGEADKAKLLKAEYFDILETLRKYEKDKEQIATATEELVRKNEVEKDLAERLPAVVSSLEYLIDRVDPIIQSISDRGERKRVWRRELAACFKGMATSRYAKPFNLSAA